MVRILLSAALCATAQDAVARPVETVRGVVTFERSSDAFAFMRRSDGAGVRLGLARGEHVKVGDTIDATGEVTQTAPMLRLEGVKAVRVGAGRAHLPVATTIAGLYSGSGGGAHPPLFGLPVEVTARVLDVNRRRTQVQLQLADIGADTPSVTASYRLDEGRPMGGDMKIGAVVRVVAVPSMAFTFDGVEMLTLNIQSRDAVQILSLPSWWTPGKVWALSGALAVVFAMLVGWLILLSRAIAAKRVALAEADLSRRERLRLASDLHDNFQQLLAGSMFHINAAFNYFGSNSERALHHLEGARNALAHTQTGLRTALWGMTEESEGPKSLVALLDYAISRMAHWEGIVTLRHKGREPLGAGKYAGRFLTIMQEAVANAINHGAAASVRVRLSFAGGSVRMTVKDDGCGFDAGGTFGSDHMGLASMKSRIELAGGTFSIRSVRGKGTTIRAELKTAAAATA